ncbi:MAG: hypothetical protein GX149_00170, partial [Acholeplasmataceae bacterium]|nr:hypothetical protein [Acholeplasmataceae bacterium]
AAKLMATVSDSVFAFQNYGGTRVKIDSQSLITAADIFQVFPFDNQIVSVEISGRDLKTLYNREGNAYLAIDYNSINDYQNYRIATNDYLFYNSFNKRIFEPTYDDVVVYGDLYETFYQLLLNLKAAGYTTFTTNSPILLNNYNAFYPAQQNAQLSYEVFSHLSS